MLFDPGALVTTSRKGMTLSDPLSYASLSMTSRPPRVAIVIDGGEHWSYWTRRALYRADQSWGGAGFAVVPHQNGQVNPVLLRACEAYDPDFVVSFNPTLDEIEHFAPGSVSIKNTKGEQATGEERERLLKLGQNESVPIESDHAAREQLVDACSTYRTRWNGEWHEFTQSLDAEPGGTFENVRDMANEAFDSILACPANWGGTLGAAVASHAGVAEPPLRNAREPELDDQVRSKLTSWLLGTNGGAPDHLVCPAHSSASCDTLSAKTAHDLTMTHLVKVSNGINHRCTGVVILGDTAEDFALAHLWRLTFGNAYWIPSALGIDEETLPWPIALGISRISRDLARHSNTLALTSVSRSVDYMTSTRDRLHHSNPIITPSEKPDTQPTVILSPELPWRQPVTSSLAIQDHWGSIVTVPVSVNEAGTTRMVAPLPPPTLNHTELSNQPDLNWHVDVQWRPSRTVRRRGLDSRELLVDSSSFMPTWARSGRDGITYQAQRYDFVLAGTRAENKLARVALRDLSLTNWINAKCTEQNIQTRVSDKGQRTALLADMLGGREPYVTLFAGPMLPALQAMLPASPTSSKAYPEQDGVALSSNEGVLTFAGIFARSQGLTLAEAREHVDAALRAGVFRRGLVLACTTCEQKQFQTIDKLGQRWQCARCDALSELNQQAWKIPIEEPEWFYDLHPVARIALKDNSDVPALLSAYLRAQREK